MFQAIIIDDEAGARDVLANLIQNFCPQIEVIAQCSNVPEAVLKINQLEPDVVFCDIEMPEYSGFELLSFFKHIDFELVFVTAFNQYAIQAFEVSAMDYLLKPIEIARLESVVKKLEERLDSNREERLETLKSNFQTDRIAKIALPISTGLLFVELEKLQTMEADGAYTNVQIHGEKDLLVSKKIKFFEFLLESHNEFFRVHRSSLVNLNYVKEYHRGDSLLTMADGKKIRLARDRKAEFEEHIKGIKL